MALFGAFAGQDGGDTRLVLATDDALPAGASAVGFVVAHPWVLPPSASTGSHATADTAAVVYDGWEQCLGETLFHPEIHAALQQLDGAQKTHLRLSSHHWPIISRCMYSNMLYDVCMYV